MMKMNKHTSRLWILSFCCLYILTAALSGCSLARVNAAGKESKDDTLCGVWVVSGKDTGHTDPDGFSAMDANTLLFYQEETNGEFISHSEVSGAFDSSLQGKTNNGKSSAEYFGTLYVTESLLTDARIYSIYQRTDGSRYAGSDVVPVSVNLAVDESYSCTLDSPVTAVTDGTTRPEPISFMITFAVHKIPGSISVVELGEDNQVIQRSVLDLDHPDLSVDFPYHIEASVEAEYVIIEEAVSGSKENVGRMIYSRDNFAADNPFLYTFYMPDENDLLIPQTIEIAFK